MTQAFNLSQLANNVNTTGQLNAAAGLYNQTPVANGGTGLATVATGRLLLGAGTSAMTVFAGTNTSDVLTWNGTAWTSAVAQGAPAPVLNVYTTPGSWTKTANLRSIKVTVVGGGGSGGPVTSPGGGTALGGGGGGGGTSIRIYPAPSLPASAIPYTVGAAAASSSFGVAPITVITATGGTSATPASAASGVVASAGGAGGVGSSGNLNLSGNGGVAGVGPNNAGTGGGSSLGGGSIGPNTVGAAGGNYGGGGSGVTTSSVPRSGGAGATGVVLVEEFY
jgi:hypothetical protein